MNAPTPRVFVSHAPTKKSPAGDRLAHDYSPAEKFGRVVFLTVGRFDASKRESFEPFDRLLADFHPARDFLLMAGSPVAIAAASSVASDVARSSGGDPVRLLVYDDESQDYRVVTMPVEQEKKP